MLEFVRDIRLWSDMIGLGIGAVLLVALAGWGLWKVSWFGIRLYLAAWYERKEREVEE